MERTPNKSQHTKLTLDKKFLLPLLPRFELATFLSRLPCTKTLSTTAKIMMIVKMTLLVIYLIKIIRMVTVSTVMVTMMTEKPDQPGLEYYSNTECKCVTKERLRNKTAAI